MKKLILLISICLLSACSVRVSPVDTEEFVGKIRYFKDTNGLCFGVVAIKQGTSIVQNGIGMAHVPCDKIGM